MLVKNTRRLAFLIGPIITLLYVGISFYSHSSALTSTVKGWIATKSSTNPQLDLPQSEATVPDTDGDLTRIAESSDGSAAAVLNPAPNDASSPSASNVQSHHEIFSLSTADTKYFPIEFGDVEGMNPNIIPHPKLDNTWIVVAQRRPRLDELSLWFAELVCNAVFYEGALRCVNSTSILPIAATVGNHCEGDLSFFNSNIGPHDARALYGPQNPYVVYGSNSQFTCFGQFIQDFRVLMDWGLTSAPTLFRLGTELQRPRPWNAVEKNWFPFWDSAGEMYLHYDVAPKRAYAHVKADGSVGPNMATAAVSDKKCLQRYLPKLGPELESIHQATNSLRVTMCRQADPSCIADESNTFLFTIFQHKTYFNFHSVYEPYVMIFKQKAPFAIHAMSKRPFWIHGREQYPDRNTSDMHYVTSVSWKSPQRQYHGYLDDELLIAFGIEDTKAGGIDVLAGSFLEDLELCSEG